MKIKAYMYVNIVRIKGIFTHACVCICVYFEKRDLYFWLAGVWSELLMLITKLWRFQNEKNIMKIVYC